MARRREVLLLSFVLLGAVFTGCLGELSDPADVNQAGPSDEAGGQTQDGFQLNQLLQDQPEPYNTYVSGGAEPMILADADGEWVLIADTDGVYRSDDDGATWDTVPDPFIETCDGISLAQDDTGAVYAASTVCAAIQTARYDPDTQTWSNQQHATDVSPVADRPWNAAQGDGDVAVVHYDYGRTFSEYCLHSTDRGVTYPDRTVVRDTGLLSGTGVNAGNLVFDDAGNLIWAADDDLHFRAPVDIGGQPVQCNAPIQSIDLPGDDAPQIFTQADTDGENAYAAYPDQEFDPNIEEWIKMIRVAGTQDLSSASSILISPTDGANVLRTNTFVALSVTDDEVAIAWYGTETPGDPSQASFSGTWNVFVAQVDNYWSHAAAGSSAPILTCQHADVTCTRLTDEPNHVGDLCMGGLTGCGSNADRDLLDYFGIDHGPDGTVYVAYGHDGFSDNARVRFACVGPSCPTS